MPTALLVSTRSLWFGGRLVDREIAVHIFFYFLRILIFAGVYPYLRGDFKPLLDKVADDAQRR